VILKWKLVTQEFRAIVPPAVYNESESFGNKPNILDDRPSSIEYQMNQLDLVSNFRD